MASPESAAAPEATPLLTTHPSFPGPSSEPNHHPHRDHLDLTQRATGRIWSYATHGTRIYILNLLWNCFVAAFDPPFKASLTKLYKEFLCCQQDAERCHDKAWCDGPPGDAAEGGLSALFKWQSIFLAAGGAISVFIWYLQVLPRLARNSPSRKLDMTSSLLLSQAGVFVFEVINALVGYAASKNWLSVAQFKCCVVFAPVCAFLLGGGPSVSFVFRENIIAVAVGHTFTRKRDDDPTEETTEKKLFRIDSRQTAYVLSAVCPLMAQLISGRITVWFVKRSSGSAITQVWCLVGGLACYAIGLFFLCCLPPMPLPSDNETTQTSPTSLALVPQPAITPRRRILPSISPAHVITTLVILSSIARSPLASSVFSNFAIRYISRRLHSDTSDAEFLTNIASIASIVPPLIPLFTRYLSASPESSPRSSPRNPRQPITVTLRSVSWPLFYLSCATLGTFMMAVIPVLGSIASTQSTDYYITQKVVTAPSTDKNYYYQYYLTLSAVALICIGTSYTVFLEPLLAGWSAEGKRPNVFLAQQMLDAGFRILGAWLLNWGFQREMMMTMMVRSSKSDMMIWRDGWWLLMPEAAEDQVVVMMGGETGSSDTSARGRIGWTYLIIMVVCLVAAGLLLAAVVFSRNVAKGGEQAQDSRVSVLPGVATGNDSVSISGSGGSTLSRDENSVAFRRSRRAGFVNGVSP